MERRSWQIRLVTICMVTLPVLLQGTEAFSDYVSQRRTPCNKPLPMGLG